VCVCRSVDRFLCVRAQPAARPIGPAAWWRKAKAGVRSVVRGRILTKGNRGLGVWGVCYGGGGDVFDESGGTLLVPVFNVILVCSLSANPANPCRNNPHGDRWQSSTARPLAFQARAARASGSPPHRISRNLRQNQTPPQTPQRWLLAARPESASAARVDGLGLRRLALDPILQRIVLALGQHAQRQDILLVMRPHRFPDVDT
jgi:hypothetical protein